MSPWIVGSICLVAGGTIGAIVMACCAVARDADQRAEFNKFLDSLKLRVWWTCPECKFLQVAYVPAFRGGRHIEGPDEIEVCCSPFMGGCGKRFLIARHTPLRIEVTQPDSDDVEVSALQHLVDDFSDAMETKLIEKHHQGYRGWNNPANKDMIAKSLKEHVERGTDEYVDIANLAAMMWNFERMEAADHIEPIRGE